MKKNTFFLLYLILIITFTFNGCSISTAGNTLHGFTQRMNEKNPAYSMTNSGYIYDETESTLTKYYVINNTDIMLRFKADHNNRLCSMNIVFDNLTESNTQELEFIKNCIECYCESPEISAKLLSQTDFPKVLFTKDINTIKNKIGNIEILIDVTDIGCVISVVQNTQ